MKSTISRFAAVFYFCCVAIVAMRPIAAYAQDDGVSISVPKWYVAAQFYDYDTGRSYFGDAVYVGPQLKYNTAEEACESGVAALLPKLRTNNLNAAAYQEGMAYSGTRPYGEVKFIFQNDNYLTLNGKKCTVDGWESGSSETMHDIYENGEKITTAQYNEDEATYTHKKAWVGSISAILTCESNETVTTVDGELSCASSIFSGAVGAPDCEGSDGDSPLSTPPKKCAGNPIAIDSGAKQQRDVDYATADGLLGIERKYRSNSRPSNLSDTVTEIPSFGTSWRGLLPGRITIKQDTDNWRAEFLNDEGGTRRFTLIEDNVEGHSFAATGTPTRLKLGFSQPNTCDPASFFSSAALASGPADMRLSYANGDYVIFRRAGQYDAASKTRDFVPIEHGLANGYKRWFDYPDTGQYPNKIRDSLGREMTLDWTEIGWASTQLRGYSKAPGQASPPIGMAQQKAISSIVLPDGTRMTYTYGASSSSGFLGRLESAKRLDAANAVLWGRSYLYEDTRFRSALTGMLDQNGARLSTYSYNAEGKAASTERAGGFDKQLVEYSTAPDVPGIENYGQPIDIREVTNPLGAKSTYSYSAYSENYSGSESPGPDPRNTPRRLFKVETAATEDTPAHTREYDYTNRGLLAGVTDANGNSTTQFNDPEMRPETIIDATGVQTQIQWRQDLDLPVQTIRKQLQTNYTYSAEGQLTGVTLTDTQTGAARQTQLQPGVAGRVQSINGPRQPDAQGRDDVTTMAYDAQGNMLTSTNALGHVTRYEGYDPNGRPARVIDPNGVVAEISYDLVGRAKTTTIKHPTDPTKDAVTAMDYDVEGRVTAITRPDTVPLRFEYNLAGLMTAMRSDDGERVDYTHDPMGNVTSQTVKRADGTQARGVTRSFDQLGRLLTLTLGADRTSRFRYDNVGNVTKVTSARGNAVDQSFDALNRLVNAVAPDGGKAQYGYAGGSISTTGPDGTFVEPVTTGSGDSPANELGAFRDPNGIKTSFTRNAFGQVTQETSPDRGISTFTYDAAGDLASVTDGRGQRIDFTRDISGRVLTKTPVGRPLSERVTYTYDTPAITGSASIGRLSRIDDGSGVTRFAYDHRGNLVTRFQKLVGTPDWVALRYAYDLADRIETMTYPSGRQVRYLRDAKGRVVGVRTRASSAVATWTIVSQNISYEPFAALKTISYGNGDRMIVTTGDDGRMDGRRLYRLADGSNISHLTYAYDADDNLTRITDRLDATKTRSFAYDAVGRLSRVTLASGDMQRTDYVYDANGNKTRELRRPLPTDPPSVAAVDRYTLAPGSNRLAKIVTPNGNRTLGYDPRGNMLTEARPGGITVSAGYDGQGRLISYARSGEASLTHVYNGMDDRVATTTTLSGGTADTRRFIYAPDGRVLGEYGSSASDVKAEFIWLSPQVGDAGMFGGDDGLGGYMPLAVATPDPITGPGATQLSWVHANHMGVPIRYSNATGQTLSPPTSYSIPGFPGQSRTFADLYYNRYRDYDTSTGRYIQADPIGLAGGASPYSYAMNNPLRYSDPLGLMTYWEYYTGTPDSYRVNIMNSIAGLSDSATLGGTYFVRDLLGLNGEITDCNPFYGYGEWGSFALGAGGIVKYGLRKAGNGLITEGIYEFTGRTGLTYVGQSGNIPVRLLNHLATRKLPFSELPNVLRTEVLGGRTAREIAEQLRINALGGIDALENVRNPIGYGRRHLLPNDPRWF